MTDVIDYTLVGDDMQLVKIELDPQKGVRAFSTPTNGIVAATLTDRGESHGVGGVGGALLGGILGGDKSF